MNLAEYKYQKGRFKRTSLFIHKNSLKFSLAKGNKYPVCFLESFGHVEIKQILLVGEIAS